jgi:membrane-bound serine protease (ClpP class)
MYAGALRRRFAVAVTGLACVGVLLAAPAAAQEERPSVDVVKVSGWIDPVMVDFLTRSIEDSRATALVLQIDSPGALTDVEPVVAAIEDAAAPVIAWVGGPGAKALGEAGRIVTAAPISGMAPKARLTVGPDELDPAEAERRGVVELDVREAAVLRNVLLAIDGRRVGDVVIDTVRQRTLFVDPRFSQLEIGPRILHTVASPPVAYLLLLVGLALLVFELFTGGFGIAGVVGAASLALSAYGLAVLPMSWVGLVLLLVSMFGFAIDVQTGVPRVWTGVGVVTLVVGSLLLFDDPVQLGWLPLVGGVVGVVLMMLAGLPATVRSRFSTPTIGRESMIGEVGEAVAALDPEGVVRVRGALWPARTNRATPLAVGDPVEVVGIDGARLEVARTGAETPLVGDDAPG